MQSSIQPGRHHRPSCRCGSGATRRSRYGSAEEVSFGATRDKPNRRTLRDRRFRATWKLVEQRSRSGGKSGSPGGNSGNPGWKLWEASGGSVARRKLRVGRRALRTSGETLRLKEQFRAKLEGRATGLPAGVLVQTGERTAAAQVAVREQGSSGE
jgi:hypothetical protein